MYVKLFSSIYQGTLRGNSDGLLVFTNLLAHADRDGVADIHPRAIGEETGLPVERVRDALLMLESPDDESRSPAEQGRRIVRIDEHRAWGWQIVNYAKYREIRSEEDRREQNREAQKRWRDKHKSAASAGVSHGKPLSAHAEVSGEEEANTKARVRATTCPEGVSEEVFAQWKAQRRVKKAAVTKIVIDGIRREAGIAGISLEQAMTIQIEMGWQGFKADWLKNVPKQQEAKFV